MNNIAAGLSIIALAFGGYTYFELQKIDDGGKLEALQKQVAALDDALVTETNAREAAEARLAKSEGRLDALEAPKPEPEPEPEPEASVGPLTTTELIVQSADGKKLLRLGANRGGGGQIEVFAKNGKRVAVLFARSDNDGELALYDESGILRSNIGGNDTGGYANFYGSGKQLAAYIGADTAKSHGYIAVYGPGKKEVVGLYANAKGGVVSVRNAETKKQVVMIGAAPNNGMGFIGLGTTEGKPASAFFVTRNGGQIKTLNADGKTAAFLGVSANPAGNGLLYLCRKDGERIVEAGATATRGGYCSMNNGQSKRVLFMGASTGTAPDDGVLEVARKNGKLGVVLRAYSGGSSVRVYDKDEKVKVNLR